MVKQSKFGTVSGQETTLFEFGSKTDNGLTFGVTNLGASLTYATFPDKSGKYEQLICGFDSSQGYLNDTAYHGRTVGRVANRIKDAQFVIDGKTFSVTRNHGQHCLHGGEGIHNKVWSYEVGEQQVRFDLVSPDGEDGFPGELKVSVTYILVGLQTLKIKFEATTSAPTLCNLAQHAYFNLAGVGKGDIYSHFLKINADKYTENSEELITTGEIFEVSGSRFDFRKPRRVGEAMKNGALGFDENFCLNPDAGSEIPQIILLEPKSGRTLGIRTTQPGVQLYTGNFLDGKMNGHGGSYAKHSALCLETQHFPGAERFSHFPSITLRPGEVYSHETSYSFQCNA